MYVTVNGRISGNNINVFTDSQVQLYQPNVKRISKISESFCFIISCFSVGMKCFLHMVDMYSLQQKTEKSNRDLSVICFTCKVY